MINYASDTKKAVKNFENEGAPSLSENAVSFIENTEEKVQKAASNGGKLLKEEGMKDIRKATDYFKDHPIKGAAYALGVGAVLSYLLIPRK